MESDPIYLQPGVTVGGRYRLNHLIGRGGVGEVWQAEDLSLRRLVAVKTILPGLVETDHIERFATEARVIAQLNHPGIVQVFDTGREGGNRYIVMEFVDGKNLGLLIRDQLLPMATGLRIALQMARALHFAHTKGVLHRDVKPSNVLIDSKTGDAKLTDFGVAKILKDRQALTNTAVVGTPFYMSPEQISGAALDFRSDIYSLGSTFYQLFTGQLPHQGADLAKLVMLIATTRPTEPIQHRADLPQELNRAILKMLEPNPGQRMASLTEVVDTLESLATKNPASDFSTVSQPSSAPTELLKTMTSVGKLRDVSAPTGFFDSDVFPQTKFFPDDAVRFTKIQETLQFYRDHLSEEYLSLMRQANTTYRLWLLCVIMGFLVLLAGVVAMLAGFIGQGIATSASTVLVFFIQRVFQQREDHYRELARAKNGHLEYGNQWLLVIQTIDSIDDREQRKRRQETLVDVLTEKLQMVKSPKTRAAAKAGKRQTGKTKVSKGAGS